MPPLIIPSALSTLAKYTGFVPDDAASSPSSSLRNGLSTIPTIQSPELNTISTQPLIPGAVPKPPPVDFKREAEFGFGEKNIAEYLTDLYQKKDQNIAFQDIVKKVVGQTFTTPGGINPRMNEIRDRHYNTLTQAALNHIQYPNDVRARNAFYRLLVALKNDATRNATSGGGRKTARNSRSRSRGRSRKQYKKLKRSSRNRHR